MGSSWKPLVKNAAAGFMLGCCIYGAGDVLSDYTTYHALQERAMRLANESEELKEQIGYPFSLGPWYNASIGFSAGGNLAQCGFQVQGTKQITDIRVRGMRHQGFRHNAMYNLFGPGDWTIVDCNAMFPAGGGLVKPKSLLPEKQPTDDNTEQSSDASAAPAASQGTQAASQSNAASGSAAHAAHASHAAAHKTATPKDGSSTGNAAAQPSQEGSSPRADPAVGPQHQQEQQPGQQQQQQGQQQQQASSAEGAPPGKRKAWWRLW